MTGAFGTRPEWPLIRLGIRCALSDLVVMAPQQHGCTRSHHRDLQVRTWARVGDGLPRVARVCPGSLALSSQPLTGAPPLLELKAIAFPRTSGEAEAQWGRGLPQSHRSPGAKACPPLLGVCRVAWGTFACSRSVGSQEPEAPGKELWAQACPSPAVPPLWCVTLG